MVELPIIVLSQGELPASLPKVFMQCHLCGKTLPSSSWLGNSLVLRAERFVCFVFFFRSRSIM